MGATTHEVVIGWAPLSSRCCPATLAPAGAPQAVDRRGLASRAKKNISPKSGWAR